jgi:hypothetical protein
MTDDQLGRCWECGYSLRGLSARRCPECGRPFDPADPTSMNMGQEVRGLARWLMRPPGWPMDLAVGAAALLSLWATAIPMPRGQIGYVLLSLREWFEYGGEPWRQILGRYDVPEIRFLYAIAAWALVALVWTARRVARGITVRRLSKHKPAPLAYWGRWLTPHFVLAATVLFCTTPGPLYLGFWASQRDMVRFRQQQLATRQQLPPGVNWIGIYPSGAPFQPETWAEPGVTPATGPAASWAGSRYENFIHVSQWGGFAYAPQQPPEIDASRLRYLGAGWYSFEWNVGMWR